MAVLDTDAVDALLARARREVDSGILPGVQMAVALEGEVVLEAAFGEATVDTRMVAYSCTKPVVAAAVWRLVADGSLDPARTVASYIPEFGTNGKDVVTLEQVMLHTCGFPMAPLGHPDWLTSDGRRAAFSRWRLTFEPGTAYQYHAVSAHWVLAELVEVATGRAYGDALVDLVTGPLGLPRLLGIPEDEQGDVLIPVIVGELPTPDEMQQAFGMAIDISELIGPDVAIDMLANIGRPEALAAGIPGGGGVMRARELALFYQALLHDPAGLWPPDLLADVTGRVRNTFADWTGVGANRTLGLVVAGDHGRSHMRGMGRTVGPRAFGHNGAGGQVAWADPDSGLSFVYFTNGLDKHLIRERRRVTAVASLAGVLRG